MRAVLPTSEGRVEVATPAGCVEIGWEAYGEPGDDRPVLLLMPTSCIVPMRAWKLQIPYLSRHYRVIAFDGPGNGVSSKPAALPPYTAQAHVDYALAVLDATGVERCSVIGVSGGTHRTLLLAADHPERVASVVMMGPYVPLGAPPAAEVGAAMQTGDHEVFLDTFMRACFNEPHSTKAIEDGIEWGRGTTLGLFGGALLADQPASPEAFRDLCARITCPVLVVQGTDDLLTPEPNGRALVDAIGANARLVLIEGGGHRPDLRDPVRFSRLVREFVVTAPRERSWPRAVRRRPRALYLSSPIGLGHARRDVAIVQELRALRPELEIDWLAQDPVTRVLAVEGERIHPASRHLASESAHMESESAGHDLHCFQAWREMDEILVANFMVLHDVLEAEHYDLVIGDEAWEADHFLHENPELKRGAFAWLTDFVGWLPMDGEERLTADYNAEMLEHVERYPWVRDCSLFVGEVDDVVPLDFGPGLPSIRDWTQQHFAFPGYITGFEPVDREQVRAELGWGPDDLVCVATVGGSSVGRSLLDLVTRAFPIAKAQQPALRMLVVTGPRIDPVSVDVPGLEVTGFVPGLHRHLAACDLAVVQGGLTTAMELTAAGRPFLYFPLLRHFEQQVHVPHRLARYGAGRRMDYATTDPEFLADAIVAEVGRPMSYLPVATDGAARAAAVLAGLV